MSNDMAWDSDYASGSLVHSEETKQGHNFTFVNLSNCHRPNSSEQISVIRQHAMKNVGRLRRKPKPITRVDLIVELCIQKPTWWLSRRWATLSKFASHVKLPGGVQLENDERGRQLLSEVFRDGGNGGAQIHLRDAWFTLGLRYESAMFQILANSALHETMVRSGTLKAAESYDSMRFHGRTLTSLRLALQTTGRQYLEEGISAITGLLVYEELRGNGEIWSIHLQGLHQLVNHAGGISALERNEELRVSISWCELRGACVFDKPPSYPLPRQWDEYSILPSISAKTRAHINHTRCIWRHSSWIECSEWSNAYELVAVFSFSAFSSLKHQNLDIRGRGDYGAWANPVMHTFLSWRPPASSMRPESLMQEACRLGMLLYLNHVRRFLGILPSCTDILAGKLKDHLMANKEYLMGDWVGETWILQIWVLYMAGFALQGGPDEAWFFCALGSSLKRHGLLDWYDVLQQMKRVLWFEEVFRGPNDERVQNGAMWWVSGYSDSLAPAKALRPLAVFRKGRMQD